MSDSYKKIGIDCRFWGVTHAGLGRYTRELVLEIIKKCSKQYQFTLFFQQDEWRKDKQLYQSVKLLKLMHLIIQFTKNNLNSRR